MILRHPIILFLSVLLLGLSCSGGKDSSLSPNQQDRVKSELDTLITIMKSDMHLHKDVADTIGFDAIKAAEMELGVELPSSYKYFLSKFGNGANWLYHVDQSVNGVDKQYGSMHRFGKYRKLPGDMVNTDGFGTFHKDSLLCLMTDSSNGGAWCFITSENKDTGEWPLAFYNMNDGKLYYKVSGFMEWLIIAVHTKGEVIRVLDKKHRLGLG